MDEISRDGFISSRKQGREKAHKIGIDLISSPNTVLELIRLYQ